MNLLSAQSTHGHRPKHVSSSVSDQQLTNFLRRLADGIDATRREKEKRGAKPHASCSLFERCPKQPGRPEHLSNPQLRQMLSSCHVLTPGPLKSKILRKAKFFDPYFHSQNVLQPQAILGSVAAKSQGLELAFAALTKAQLEGAAPSVHNKHSIRLPVAIVRKMDSLCAAEKPRVRVHTLQSVVGND